MGLRRDAKHTLACGPVFGAKLKRQSYLILLPSLVEQLQITLIDKCPVAGLACELAQDVVLHQSCNQVVGCLVRCADKLLNVVHRDNRTGKDMFQNAMSIAGSAAKVVVDYTAVIFAQSEYALDRVGRLLAHRYNAAQEESKPFLP